MMLAGQVTGLPKPQEFPPQKFSLNPNWMFLGKFPWFAATNPKFTSVGFVFGLPRIGVFRILNASARNWKLTRSVKLNRLFSDMSHCGRHGLRITLLRNGIVCRVFGPRIAHAGLEHGVNAVRVAFGCTAVPFNCSTQVLKYCWKLAPSSAGLPIRFTLPG